MSSSAFKNLPPHVVRELKRHINPKPVKQVASAEAGQQQATLKPSSSVKWVVGGCVALVGTAASFPILATWWIRLNDKDEPLTASQVRRGAFNNSGSRDVGKDPNWDFSKGEYKKDAGYYAIFEEEKKKKLPGHFLAMDDAKMKKHEEQIKAFAHGEKPN